MWKRIDSISKRPLKEYPIGIMNVSKEPRRIQLRILIENYVKASVDRSWLGSAHPEDHYSIEEEPRKSKKALDKFIGEL